MNQYQEIKIGFIFDLDGTILDDIGFALNLPAQLAEIYHVTLTSELQQKIETQIIEPLSHSGSMRVLIFALLRLAKFYGIPWYQRVRFLRKVEELYKEARKNFKIFPGIEPTLDLCKQYGSIGIFTTTPWYEIMNRFRGHEQFLDRFGDNIIAGDQVKKTKPDPEGILRLSTKWGIPPQFLIMVGDSDVDIIAGKRAGTKTIGVLSGFSHKETFESVKADWILPNLIEIGKNLDTIIASLKES